MIEIVERVIVLSWIQNFFQKFIKDKDDEYAEYDIHNKQQNRSLPHKLIEGSHHLNTKVSYQYPKGNLKFQLKSEAPLEKSEKANRRKRVEQAPEMRSSETKSLPESKKSLPSVPKKPFQLTEIPSPIFGFNRPIKTPEKVVEHELSHFFDDELEYQLDSDNRALEPESHTDMEIAASETAVGLFEVKETVVDSPVLVTKVEEETIESKNLNIPKRSPLPFNVMMLKQDKLKWEERKRTRTVPTKEIQQEITALEDKPKAVQQEITALEDTPKEMSKRNNCSCGSTQ